MNNQHPITPPPELVKQWCHENGDEIKTSPRWYQIVATQAARWGADQQLKLDAEQIAQAYQKGADQELEACCEWLDQNCNHCWELLADLRAARRPKPPTLKEQALAALREVGNCEEIDNTTYDTIRRALEALPE